MPKLVAITTMLRFRLSKLKFKILKLEINNQSNLPSETFLQRSTMSIKVPIMMSKSYTKLTDLKTTKEDSTMNNSIVS